MRNFLWIAFGCASMLGACATSPLNKAEPASGTAVLVTAKPSKPKPFIAGQAQPLVCKTPVAKKGSLKDRPNLQIMWENFLHDKPEGVWRTIGGKVEVNGNLPFDQGQWTNACTVRLSYMLNKAGHKVPRNGNKTVSGARRNQHYYRVTDMEQYLLDIYGKPDVSITDGSANSFDLPTEPGIVLMDFPDSSFTGHVTIWNGAGTVDGSNIGGYRVLFWKLPCFIPPDRAVPVASLGSAYSALP